MNKIKHIIQNFIATLHQYDYILFGVCAGLFFLILILAILLRKQVAASLILVILAFISIIAGPIFGYQYIHQKLYGTTITNLTVKELEFSEALVIKGNLINQGTEHLKKCNISLSAYKGADNFLEELVYPLKPFQKMSIVKEVQMEKNESVSFKMILEPFTYSKEYNISIKASCL